ncbi:serine hydroxymethyltransferase [Candidatus Amesbacteria bacterium RIFCSPHIGHO2_01_FULL_48_32]|uniref:Serine hydroxymethyltransferase n=1 Tax=Candidatus Amesbacteria bacterium RIFCSPLOWO2_01_FULL_48_25 TaxID=1797259 RepID=A0A1F4ZBS8_9BACT|nr:MAG: serine hydroxymethyltransferase [Candidatus Amesbacteria bacterium RIFCSPHIGHO2_01_FULL_48_32]OGD03645.1 MAG: serine hydroxymethyltransferase [Candidatus Amesbacteria bacterium RIFCSPLOWO2_01_FULL_48_25]HJZ06009.1 serine hydroxymethyltransferase [Patescibacteria group bacterium]
MDEVFELIKSEEKRQGETLMMIPSENYASRAVRQAMGSVLNNKYSEGYPGKRYYQGNKYVDDIENIAIERVKKLFAVKYANVQPYSGSPANAAVLMALVGPGEKIMGMKLSGGGHLTHGHPKITFSGKYYQSGQYDVNDEGWIDYDEVERMARAEKPKLIIAGTTAYPRILDFSKFGKIAHGVGAYLLADISHIAGLVVAGTHPSPVGHADVVMTTTHKTLRGPRGAILMTDNEETARKIDRAVFPGLQGGPHNSTTAAIAVALVEAGTPEFKEYGVQVVKNAKVLSDELTKLGFKLTTGGTDNHLVVINLGGGGKEAAVALEEAGIIVNYNAVPHDSNPPANPSGLRLGTPAVTTRGMEEEEMKQIAQWISDTIRIRNNVSGIREIRNEVKKMCKKFPVP